MWREHALLKSGWPRSAPSYGSALCAARANRSVVQELVDPAPDPCSQPAGWGALEAAGRGG